MSGTPCPDRTRGSKAAVAPTPPGPAIRPPLRAAEPRTSTATAHPRSGVDPSSARTVSSHELFGDATEVLIDHAGVVYRLKRTALGKLILTK